MTGPKPHLAFDGMCWPNPDDPLELAYKLNHGHQNMTGAEAVRAATYIAAYRQLIEDTPQVRNSKITRLRAARDEQRAQHQGDDHD